MVETSACPDFIALGAMLKAVPATEGDRRFLYCEASNEGLDQQGEVIAAKALADSRDYFLRFGNCDIDHYTLIGAKAGIPDYPLYEVGRPVEVGQREGRTFVKSEIYSGSGPAAARANMLWSGLVDCSPPQRWYPSVGGSVLGKAQEVGEGGARGKTLVTKVRWSNIGFSKTPVNQHVGVCATMPVGVFAKCWGAGGLDISAAVDLTAKALTAEGGSDSATLTGGAALRMQSLDARGDQPRSYFDFQDRLAGAMRRGAAGKRPGAADLHSYAVKKLGLPEDQAAEWTERFLRDLRTDLERKAA